MRAMLVELWTHEPYAFPLYNASKHGDKSPGELEMNMERACMRVVGGQSVWIPCTVGHTNTFNDLLRKELIRRRDEGLNNVARDGVGEAPELRPVEDGDTAARMEAARKAREALREGQERVMAARAEKNKGTEGLEAPVKKGKGRTAEEELARMRDQLGLFE